MRAPIPWTVWLSVAIMALGEAYVLFLPGAPSYSPGRAGLVWGLLTLLLAVLIIRGSRRAWSVSLGLNVLLVALILVLTVVPWPPKLIGYLVIEAGLVAVLLTSSLRRYVH